MTLIISLDDIFTIITIVTALMAVAIAVIHISTKHYFSTENGEKLVNDCLKKLFDNDFKKLEDDFKKLSASVKSDIYNQDMHTSRMISYLLAKEGDYIWSLGWAAKAQKKYLLFKGSYLTDSDPEIYNNFTIMTYNLIIYNVRHLLSGTSGINPNQVYKVIYNNMISSHSPSLELISASGSFIPNGEQESETKVILRTVKDLNDLNVALQIKQKILTEKKYSDLRFSNLKKQLELSQNMVEYTVGVLLTAALLYAEDNSFRHPKELISQVEAESMYGREMIKNINKDTGNGNITDKECVDVVENNLNKIVNTTDEKERCLYYYELSKILVGHGITIP